MYQETLQISQNDALNNNRLSGENIQEGVLKALENDNSSAPEKNRQEQKQLLKLLDLKNELAQVAVALDASTTSLAMIFKLREKTEGEYKNLRSALGLPHDPKKLRSLVPDDLRYIRMEKQCNFLEKQKERLMALNQNRKKAA